MKEGRKEERKGGWKEERKGGWKEGRSGDPARSLTHSLSDCTTAKRVTKTMKPRGEKSDKLQKISGINHH